MHPSIKYVKDKSEEMILSWIPTFQKANMRVVYEKSSNCVPSGTGCGYAKNRAVEQSSGDFLCFLDVDDQMEEDRILLQVKFTIFIWCCYPRTVGSVSSESRCDNWI
jgi:glycosyltransferase involved in cell wall biosynthesis